MVIIPASSFQATEDRQGADLNRKPVVTSQPPPNAQRQINRDRADADVSFSFVLRDDDILHLKGTMHTDVERSRKQPRFSEFH
jgi:hypothetical protein